MRRFLLLFALLCSMPLASRGSDIAVFPTGPVFQISNLTWGSSAAGGFNNTFFFTPLFQNEFVCVNVYNNDSTSHVFVTQILATYRASSTTPSDGTWSNIGGGSLTSIVFTSPSQPWTASAGVGGAAAVAITFSSSIGSNTASVVISQTQGPCASSLPQQPPTLSQTYDNLAQGFFAANTVTNPNTGTANAALVVANSNAISGRKIYFDRVIITCSAACTPLVSTVGSGGVSCTPFTGVANTGSSGSTFGNLPGSFVAAVTQPSTCVTPPALANTIWTGPLLAATPFTFDLTGFGSQFNSGIEIGVGANLAAGTLGVTLIWHER